MSIAHAQNIVEVKLNRAVEPGGTAKMFALVAGTLTDGSVDYAIFEDEDYVGSLEGVSTEEKAITRALDVIRKLITMDMTPR